MAEPEHLVLPRSRGDVSERRVSFWQQAGAETGHEGLAISAFEETREEVTGEPHGRFMTAGTSFNPWT